MPKSVSEIKKNEETGEFYIEIERKNGSIYRGRSEDRKSVEEYKADLIKQMQQRLQKGR